MQFAWCADANLSPRYHAHHQFRPMNSQPKTTHAMKRSFLAALCFSTTSAFASSSSQILLETPVTYAPHAGVVEKIKDECHIEDI
ncbi:hypothetical protein ACLKMY_26780 [Paraburkholderia mimosarum]|uniref:hypothetical protein n=1 Tax=Paraburkholderia mimosarum TaxID=312026 RepID=UPI0039C138D5